MRRFFGRPDTRWRHQDGALHLYALPEHDKKLIQTVSNVDDMLRLFPQVAIQPLDYIHMTLQRLDLYRDEIEDDQWEFLTNQLGIGIGRLQSFQEGFIQPCVHCAAVEVVGKSRGEWQILVDCIREAFRASGLSIALTDQPFGPHYTLAYCVRDTDKATDRRIQHELDQVSTETCMCIKRVWLVSVCQSPQEGVFRFRRLMQWPLA